jgi:Restriction endonuclease BamHI
MYQWLTDRVGNYREIEPYFPVWQNLQVDEGVLMVIEVEHDGTSNQVPFIPKGTDGRALK